MVYKEFKCGSYNIHTIKTDKFKTITFKIVFRNNIDIKNVHIKTMLFDLMTDSSSLYPTKRELSLKEEFLYNEIIYTSNLRIGNQILNSIESEFLNPNLTNDDFLEEAIKLPIDLVFNPNIKNNEFNSKDLNSAKKRVIVDINSINESPAKLSIINALKVMDKDSIISHEIRGTVEDVENITSSALLTEYVKSMKHDYIDFYVLGDIDEAKVVDIINKYAKFNTIKNHSLNVYLDVPSSKTINKVTKKKDISQSHIVMLYNLNNLTVFEKKYVINVYDTILGSGSLDSKLYKCVRGDNSLCYEIGSCYQTYDNYLLIHTALDKKNVDKAKKLIINVVEDMKKNISEEELDNAIKQIVASINMGLDSANRIISNYMLHNIADFDLVDERISKYKTVTVNDVKKVAKKIKLNTIYVLEGDKNGKN